MFPKWLPLELSDGYSLEAVTADEFPSRLLFNFSSMAAMKSYQGIPLNLDSCSSSKSEGGMVVSTSSSPYSDSDLVRLDRSNWEVRFPPLNIFMVLGLC